MGIIEVIDAHGLRAARYLLLLLAIGCVCAVSAPAALATQDPVAAYSFDEGEGSVAHDDSGGEHDAAIEGAEWTTGKYGSALEFDAGAEDLLTVAADEALEVENFTLEAWVRPSESLEWAPVATNSHPAGRGYALYAGGENTGKPEGLITNQQKWFDAYVYSNQVLPLETWTHLALTSDTEDLRLYVDGELVDTREGEDVLAGAGPLLIGGDELTEGFFDGKIDEVRLYNRTLSQEEIEEDAEDGILPEPSQDPVAAYSFDEGEGSVAHDDSGNGHHGSLHDGAGWIEAGKHGGALDFDGEAAEVRIPGGEALDVTEGFTLEAWVKPTDPEHEPNPVLSQEDETPEEGEEIYAYSLYAGPGERPWGWVRKAGGGRTGIYATEEIPVGAWTHVALTADGEELRIYLDGELERTVSAQAVTASDGDLVIGGDVWNNNFKGLIDDVRVYDVALGVAEINKDKDAAIDPLPMPTDPPHAVTEAAVEVMATEATLTGRVDANGSNTAYYFEYGPTSAYGTKAPVPAKSAGSDSEPIPVAQAVSSLSQGAEYHFRLVATNEAGAAYGEDQTFETPLLPDAETEPALEVGGTEAVLQATIDPNGENTDYKFEYGTTSAYGTTVDAEESVDGSEPAEAEEGVVGLEPETTYHYRVVASSRAGTTAGPDRTVTTTAIAPPSEAQNLEFEWFGVHWGHPHEMDEPKGAEMARCSGAEVLRIELLNPSVSTTEYEEIFRLAARRHIKILPHVGSGPVPAIPDPSWLDEVQEAAEEFGAGGTFWQKHPGIASFAPTHWEIWNEPNYLLPEDNPGGQLKIVPDDYGELLEAAGARIKAADSTAKIVVGGLLSLGIKDPTIRYPVGAFIRDMKHATAYDAIGLHPYAFKTEKDVAPSGPGGVSQVVDKVLGNITEARAALGKSNPKPILITELGWPVAGPGYGPGEGEDTVHRTVSEGIQRDLLAQTIDAIEERVSTGRPEWHIDGFAYYNLQDSTTNEWHHHTGLRADYINEIAKYRPAWYAFQNRAGFVGSCPRAPKNQHKSRVVRPRKLVENTTINPYGAPTKYWIKWGHGPSSTEYGNFTPVEDLGMVEGGDIDVEAIVPDLQPGQTYHYRVVAQNDAGEKTESPPEGQTDFQITTPPPVETFTTVKRVLHGQPGYVWVGGWVKEGAAPAGSGPGVPSGYVKVNFKRDLAEPTPIESITVNVQDGQYETGYVLRGKGPWFVRTVFPAQGDYGEGYASAYHEFNIRDGVQLVAKHSGKCVDINGASTANGAPVMHGTCGDPTAAQNQVFTMVPLGDAYRFVARHSGKCIDVVNAGLADGVPLQQYDCLGAGQTNQFYQEGWWGESQYAQYVAKHSGKCLDVQGGSTGWAPFQQWSCLGVDHQLLRVQPVESGPIPTQTHLTIDQALHGSPGFVSVHGHLLAGTYPMASRVVHLEFDNADLPGWDSTGGTVSIAVDANNYYEVRDFGLGPGHWNVRARFVGNSEFGESFSTPQSFTIKRGYIFVNRFSNQCLQLAENHNINGKAIIQWPCSAINGNGQVLSYWPRGGGWYDIKVNGTNRCVDVAGGDPNNDAWLHLWDCYGGANQQWRREPIAGQAPWYALIARHSNRCASNFHWSEQPGSRIIQWDCVWAGNQQWNLQGVIEP